MHHRHLLPNEIDLLLDEETGFGVQPLREHVRGCADCSAQLAEAREVAAALSALPPIAPRFGLADRVMAQVPVFVPWHVAARDAIGRMVPSGSVTRAVAAVVIAVAGTLITGLTLWIASREDMLATVTGLAGEGVRSTVVGTAADLALALLGPQFVAMMQDSGPIGLALIGGGFLLSSLATVVGLRRLALSNRARS